MDRCRGDSHGSPGQAFHCTFTLVKQFYPMSVLAIQARTAQSADQRTRSAVNECRPQCSGQGPYCRRIIRVQSPPGFRANQRCGPGGAVIAMLERANLARGRVRSVKRRHERARRCQGSTHIAPPGGHCSAGGLAQLLVHQAHGKLARWRAIACEVSPTRACLRLGARHLAGKIATGKSHGLMQVQMRVPGVRHAARSARKLAQKSRASPFATASWQGLCSLAGRSKDFTVVAPRMHPALHPEYQRARSWALHGVAASKLPSPAARRCRDHALDQSPGAGGVHIGAPPGASIRPACGVTSTPHLVRARAPFRSPSRRYGSGRNP